MHDRGKLDQEGIPDGFDDVTVMFTHSLLDELVMDVQEPHRARFVRAHLAAEADDVSEHNRGQPPLFGMYRAAGVFLHKYGLFCWRYRAVNRAG